MKRTPKVSNNFRGALPPAMPTDSQSGTFGRAVNYKRDLHLLLEPEVEETVINPVTHIVVIDEVFIEQHR